MSNPFYNASGNPPAGGPGLSAAMRAEFLAIQAGFDGITVPSVPATPRTALVVSASGLAFETTTGELALAGNFTTTGAFNTTLVQQASVSLTLPAVNSTLIGALAGQTVSFAGSFIVSGAFNTTLVQQATLTALTLPPSNGTLARTSDVPSVAATSDILAGTDSTKYTSVAGLYAAGAPVTVTFAASLTLDMSSFINATITLTNSLTLNNPSTGMVVGKSGIIRLVQDGSGGHTLTLGTFWKVVGGAPTLTTTAGAIDHLVYWIRDSTHIECSFGANVS